MRDDVIVVGGSYAGMAAALQLLRARRTVRVIDAGRRRNRFASHSHGLLSRDGADPAALAREAREQLMRYPTLRWLDAEATAVSGARDAFVVQAGGQTLEGRRLILATGVSDTLPDIPGLSARWGRSVFHCPYCHGYELDRGRIGVIASGPASVHQAQLVAEWGETTFFPNGTFEPDMQTLEALANRGIPVDATRIQGVDGIADLLMADGRRLAFAGLFVAPRNAPASDLYAALGCEEMPTRFGTQLLTSQSKETTIPGVYACGDVAHAPHSLSLAIADGAWAGAQVHQSLVWPA